MSNPTATEIIENACRLAGLTAQLQPVDPYKIEQGRRVFNDVLAEWGASNIYIPLQTLLVFNLVANQEIYTVGPAEDNDVVSQPIVDILEVNIEDPFTNGIFYKCDVMTEPMYSQLGIRTGSGVPSYVLPRLYDSYTELRFQSPPYMVMSVEMLCKQRLQTIPITALSAELQNIPSFAARALKYEVAKELMQIFTKPISPSFEMDRIRIVDKFLAANIGVDPYVKKDTKLGPRGTYFPFLFGY